MWMFRFAIRDLRKPKALLIAVVLCMGVGIGFLLLLDSLSQSVQVEINRKSTALLGADVVISGSEKFPPEILEIANSYAAKIASETVFFTLLTPVGQHELGARLGLVQAVTANFPLAGELFSLPSSALREVLDGQNPFLLIDEGLYKYFSLSEGDALRIGRSEIQIRGVITGGSSLPSLRLAIAPRVIISEQLLSNTGLLQQGSRVNYKIYLLMKEINQLELLRAKLAPYVDTGRLSVETYLDKRKSFSNLIEKVSLYLSLVQVLAVLIVGIAIASGSWLYARERRKVFAIFYGLGATEASGRVIVVLQFVILSLFSVVLGVVMFYIFQKLLPAALYFLLPFELRPELSLFTVLRVGLGFAVISVFFSLMGIVSNSDFSPISLMRGEVGIQQFGKAGWGKILLRILFVTLMITLICLERVGDLWVSTLGIGGLGCALLFLWAVYRVVRRFIAYLSSASGIFVFRHGARNFIRSVPLTISVFFLIGSTSFLFSFSLSFREGLIKFFEKILHSGQANAFVFDVQKDQVTQLEKLFKDKGVSIYAKHPMVNMRLVSVGVDKVSTLSQQPDREIPQWVLRREYRSTYRNELSTTETLLAGTFHPSDLPEGTYPVSIEKGLAEKLKVNIGVRLTFDVQGVRLQTIITSIREVDWNQVSPNFFFVLSTAALHDAPQSYVYAVYLSSVDVLNSLYSGLLAQLPNISVVDGEQVLQAIATVATYFVSCIEYLAILMSVIVGITLAILAAGISAVNRQGDSLLKVLGLSPRQLMALRSVDNCLLSFTSAGAGAVLALIVSSLFGQYKFHTWDFTQPLAVLFGGLSVALIGVAISYISAYLNYRQPSLKRIS